MLEHSDTEKIADHIVHAIGSHNQAGIGFDVRDAARYLVEERKDVEHFPTISRVLRGFDRRRVLVWLSEQGDDEAKLLLRMSHQFYHLLLPQPKNRPQSHPKKVH